MRYFDERFGEEFFHPKLSREEASSPKLSRLESFFCAKFKAAVAPELGKRQGLILPYANTKMMNLFLSQISQEFADYFVILQLDKADWHRSNALKVPENIRLIFQPAHSPELMPVEHIWEDIP